MAPTILALARVAGPAVGTRSGALAISTGTVNMMLEILFPVITAGTTTAALVVIRQELADRKIR